MHHLILAAILSASTDAPAVEVLSGTIRTRVETVDVVGGCYLPAPTCIAKAKELRELRTENAALRAEPSRSGEFALAVVAFVVGVVAGGAVVVAIRR